MVPRLAPGSAPDDGLLFRSGIDLAGLVRRREVSPVELTRLALDRIERLDPALNSFVLTEPEKALAAARDAEARAGAQGTGPFHGVPTAIKDLHLTEGTRTTFGTEVFADFVPPFDDETVARLRRAGFVFLGKTNVPEFGTVPYTESRLLGPARNPWDPRRSPGGSSGGAAAAVAAGLVPVAHASDGGGSIRIPAANCGLVGLKPSRGRISQAPLFGDQLAGLTTSGPITRFVEDAAAMLDCMAGYAPGDPHWAPPPDRPFLVQCREDPPALRVGVATHAALFTVGPEALRATQEAAELIERLGHTVEPVALPLTPQLMADFTTVWSAGLAAQPVPADRLEPFNQWLHAQASAQSSPELLAAVRGLQAAAREIVAASLAFDVVLSPALTRPPLRVGEFASLAPSDAYQAAADYVGFAPVANITGQPSISLPVGVCDDGLPMGVLLTGRPAGEGMLLRLGRQMEAATGWTDRRPDLETLAGTR